MPCRRFSPKPCSTSSRYVFCRMCTIHIINWFVILIFCGIDISTGSLWSNEMNYLSQCGSSYEAAICLERIKSILNSIKYEDRINFCKEDFDLTINRLLQKSGPKYFWNSNLRCLIREVNEIYFNQVYIFYYYYYCFPYRAILIEFRIVFVAYQRILLKKYLCG